MTSISNLSYYLGWNDIEGEDSSLSDLSSDID